MHANMNPPQDAQLDSQATELLSAEACCKQVDFLLQPIADIGTGVVYGYDAQPQIADGTIVGTYEDLTLDSSSIRDQRLHRRSPPPVCRPTRSASLFQNPIGRRWTTALNLPRMICGTRVS